MVAMLSRKSGLFYTDFGYDYSCLVIRNGVIIFATKQDYPNYKGKLLPPPYHPIHQKISHFNLAWMFIKIPSFDGFIIDLKFLCQGFSEQYLWTHIATILKDSDDSKNRFVELGPLTIYGADIVYGIRSTF